MSIFFFSQLFFVENPLFTAQSGGPTLFLTRMQNHLSMKKSAVLPPLQCFALLLSSLNLFSYLLRSVDFFSTWHRVYDYLPTWHRVYDYNPTRHRVNHNKQKKNTLYNTTQN